MADVDHALQGRLQIRRCRGSCRSGAARAHADQALRGPMKTRRCRRSCSSGAAGPAALLHVRHCVSVNIKPRSLASTFRSAALAVRPLNLQAFLHHLHCLGRNALSAFCTMQSAFLLSSIIVTLSCKCCGPIDAHARILEGSVSEFRGLTANVADLNVEARDRGFMLTLTECFT